MNIYITYCKNIYDTLEVDKAFEDLFDAQRYVINYMFRTNVWYSDKSDEQLLEMALKYIDIFETIAKN